uniref:Uncharacterized protein n=1 Tax=Electrophorus electricus TaxID=8005 RepID=A0A4W4E8D5_ELEEL
ISSTLTKISKVPDFGGLPPSTAVRVSLITDCFSRSNAFCRTSSADTLCPLVCISSEKYPFGLSL